MNKKSTIVNHSIYEITALRERGEDQISVDTPEVESLGVEFWRSAKVLMPGGSAPGESPKHASGTGTSSAG
ncbi:MAG: hypothetical protein WCF54_12285 [Terracidiphilus sp.]